MASWEGNENKFAAIGSPVRAIKLPFHDGILVGILTALRDTTRSVEDAIPIVVVKAMDLLVMKAGETVEQKCFQVEIRRLSWVRFGASFPILVTIRLLSRETDNVHRQTRIIGAGHSSRENQRSSRNRHFKINFNTFSTHAAMSLNPLEAPH